GSFGSSAIGGRRGGALGADVRDRQPARWRVSLSTPAAKAAAGLLLWAARLLIQPQAIHAGTGCRTLISSWTASEKVAFRSFAFGFGLGSAWPSSMYQFAISRSASRIILRAEFRVLPWEFAPGKSNTRALNHFDSASQ